MIPPLHRHWPWDWPICPELKSLRLVGDQFTDDWLKHIRDLRRLQELSLVDTKVTDRGVESLRKTLPNCKIRLLSALKKRADEGGR